MSQPALSSHARSLLACPVCHAPLDTANDDLACAACNAQFPVCQGIPVLLDNGSSLFSCAQVVSGASHESAAQRRGIRHWLQTHLPRLTRNRVAASNYDHFCRILTSQAEHPFVLVIGAGEDGIGTDVIARFPQVELLLSDVYIGRRTQVVCDAHSLPIRSGSADGIIMQAVIDDLVDPARAIGEVLRILKPDGLVYSETPFLQPVHDGAFDFQRYTHLGHRRLFREFDEISSGPVGGVAQSFALAYHALLMSFAIGRRSRLALSIMARLTAWWLKYADALTSQSPAALDAACGCYFLGRRSKRVLSDRELITQYQGAQACPPGISSHAQVRERESAPTHRQFRLGSTGRIFGSA